MSYELYVRLLDAAVDRIEELAEARFTELVEASRAGYIFARDHNQYTSWRGKVKQAKSGGGGLTGLELEATVRAFQLSHPEYVVVGK